MNNYENAVKLLQTAKNVQQWNELRDRVKPILTVEELNKIDSSGLIVDVLGKDV